MRTCCVGPHQAATPWRGIAEVRNSPEGLKILDDWCDAHGMGETKTSQLDGKTRATGVYLFFFLDFCDLLRINMENTPNYHLQGLFFKMFLWATKE